MNAAEDRLSEIMDAATRALAPPIESILAEGERLGRRRRRRRRAAIATSTAVVVLMGGVGAATAFHLTHTTHDDDVAAGVTHSPSQAPATAGTPSPSPTATVDTTSAATPSTNLPLAPITDEAAMRILQMRGDPGWVFGVYNPGIGTPGALLDADINDSQGSARVIVRIGDAVQSAVKSGMDPLDCGAQKPFLVDGGKRPPGALPVSCTIEHFANGDHVMQEVTTTNAFQVYEYRIVAYRVDGVAVEITVGNGDWDFTKAPITRVAPPLTVAQWTVIALDRTWQMEVPFNLDLTPSPSASP